VATIASLTPANVTVEAGAQAVLTVRVRNGGTIVDRFELSVVGPLAAWARAEPASLSLFPGQEGEAQIAFGPPRESSPRSGTYPYGVRVRAAADPGGAVVEEGRVTIGPFTQTTAEIVPQTSRGSRGGRHEVIVENRGNAPLDAVIGAADPDRLVDFTVSPDRVVIGPGERSGVTVRASARDTFFLGAKQSHPFNVEVRPGKDQPIPLRGTFLQGPILPSWLVPAGAIAAAALVAVIVIPRLTGAGNPDTLAVASVAPSATIVPSASASEVIASASAGSSADGGGGGSGGASATPSPSASPGPFELTLIGDALTTGGALSTNCPPDPADSDCLRKARDTVRALVLTLGGPFGGRGIVTPEDVAVPNTLPLAMSRDVPFDWLAQEGAATDLTSKVVIDLAPLIAIEPGFSYAVVDSAAGPRRFVLPDQLARQLLETLYTVNPQMIDPLPTRSFPPLFEVYDPGDLVFGFEFASPAP
jgi:hypothetical protein